MCCGLLAVYIITSVIVGVINIVACVEKGEIRIWNAILALYSPIVSGIGVLIAGFIWLVTKSKKSGWFQKSIIKF